METAQAQSAGNPLGYEKIGKLLRNFAIPSIVAMVVSALYNIVDQIFIGQGVGVYGNAATNIAFPLTTLCVAVALLFGTGCSSKFSLSLGAGKSHEAADAIGNTLICVFGAGIIIMVAVLIFLEPLMVLFGATSEVLDLAKTYTWFTAFGIPFMIYTTASSHIIRADGSPKYSMFCIIFGAVLNTILDPIFIFVFDMGIAGAAIATSLSQVVSCLIAFRYVFRFKNVQLSRDNFRIKATMVKTVTSLGMSGAFNQLSLLIVQIMMNNALTHYGGMSIYGSEIALAVSGIVMKVYMLFLSIIIGIAQGNQPIVGFNYGAQNYLRVRHAYTLAVIAATCISTLGFVCFQLFPRQIIGIFGTGSEEYFIFAEYYFRTFMMASFLNGIQPVTGNFFTAIGKPIKGIFISMTRQILFLIPLILILPVFFGIDGILFAGSIADTVAFIVSILMVILEMRMMPKENRNASDRPATESDAKSS